MWLEIKQLTRLQIIRYCEKLEKENKKLKEENEWFNKKIKQAGEYVATTMKENRKLEKENKKLKKEIEKFYVYEAKQLRDIL